MRFPLAATICLGLLIAQLAPQPRAGEPGNPADRAPTDLDEAIREADAADVVRGGPNGGLSLTQARINYRQFGACAEQSIEHVRPPRPDEVA